jgi:hypothetical protein
MRKHFQKKHSKLGFVTELTPLENALEALKDTIDDQLELRDN